VELVRAATCGSVDDGKSTFIGRLLHDCGAILEDQVEALEKASRQSGEIETNLALLTDGLRAERAQKITIDVAYRHFATSKRRFLLADTPGHEQYTRNMVVGISTADIAILLVDAERGLTPHPPGPASLSPLLRVPPVLFPVNKLDAVGYAEAAYNQIADQLRDYTSNLEFADLRFVPISALKGENLASRSQSMPWYRGPSVLEYLDEVEVGTRQSPVEFRLPVQTIVRPHRGFRGYAGEVASGSIRVGDEVLVQPSGRRSRIAGLSRLGQTIDQAHAGDPIIVELSTEIDVSRGDILVRPGNPAPVASTIDAMLCWTGAPQDSKNYRALISNGDHACRVAEPTYEIDPDTLSRRSSTALESNQIGRVVISLAQPVAFDAFAQNRRTGSLMLVDAETNEVAAIGIVNRLSVTQENQRKGLVVWLTGLSGAGKSTISDLAAQDLRDRRFQVAQLDGDQLRSGLNHDLGFSLEDRTENIRRTAEVAKLLASQGLIVICSLISPLASQRALAREIVGQGFLEVYVDCSLEKAASRDPKGHYKRAMTGDLPNFTGISSPYEPPEEPDLVLKTDQNEASRTKDELIEAILKFQLLGFASD